MTALAKEKENPWLPNTESPEVKRRREDGHPVSLIEIYREYAHFQRDLRGFWSILRLCEGDENAMSAYLSKIKEKMIAYS